MGSEVKKGLLWAREVTCGAGGVGVAHWRRWGWLEACEGMATEVLAAEADILLVEDFILWGGGHSSEREGLDSVRVTCGLLMCLALADWNGDVVTFGPDIKSVFNDVRMKRWGLWLQGRNWGGMDGHATDAARGLVWYLREKV